MFIDGFGKPNRLFFGLAEFCLQPFEFDTLVRHLVPLHHVM